MRRYPATHPERPRPAAASPAGLLPALLAALLLALPAASPAAPLAAGNDAMTLEVDEARGRIDTFRLKSEKFKDDLLSIEKTHPEEANVLSLSFAAEAGSREVRFEDARAAWTVESVTRKDGAREFTFSATAADGAAQAPAPGAATAETALPAESPLSVSVKKILVLPKEGHRLLFAVKFRNESARPVSISSGSGEGGFALGLFPALGETGKDDFAVANLDARFVSHASASGGSSVEWKGDLRYAGVMDTFFLAALEFRTQKPERVVATAFDEKGSVPARLVARFGRINLDPNESRTIEFDLVVAKKSHHLLTQYKLEEVCEMGFLSVTLMNVLFFFYAIAKDWGLAIILLTVAVRLALHPLNVKQARSMKAMQKIQPLLKELQVKYANDQQRLSQEMMKLYKEHNVSPFGGCLPLLVQIPIMIALFTSLRSSIELRGERFLWLPDLAGTDPIYLLPLVIAVTMQIQQGQMNANVDPQQAAMFKFMPIMMFFLCMSLPSGVLIYWLISNVLQILQQAYEPAERPVPATVPTNRKK